MSNAANHARIARNTIFLSLRQILVMGIALYTSRVILEALGVTDFGVYNVVAGLSASFGFFSLALQSSTQRFLSVEMVRDGGSGLRHVFSVNFWLYLILAAIVIVVGAAVGPWLVYNVLNIPEMSCGAALVVFYAMVVSLAITLVAAVYDSVLIANENMKIFAYFGIFDAVTKLLIAYIVTVTPEKLMTYGLLMVVAILIPKVVMVVYCIRHYPECRPQRVMDMVTLRETFSFAGWNIYSGLAWMINEQGLNIALNIFFGPVVNAARGVAQQVNSAVVNFSNNFTVAIRPQIIKSYAVGDMDEERRLLSMASRGAFFLMWILALPIMVRIDYILSIWLVVVPPATSLFVCWTLAFLLVNTLNIPVQNVVHATGDLKRYSLLGVNAFILACPVAVGILALGAPAWSIYPVLIVGRIASTIIPLYTLRPYITIRLSDYVRRIIAPILAVVVLSLASAVGIDMLLPDTFAGLVVFGLLTFAMTLVVTAYVGITASERYVVADKIMSRFRRK